MRVSALANDEQRYQQQSGLFRPLLENSVAGAASGSISSKVSIFVSLPFEFFHERGPHKVGDAD